jgi:hypothetical protein
VRLVDLADYIDTHASGRQPSITPALTVATRKRGRPTKAETIASDGCRRHVMAARDKERHPHFPLARPLGIEEAHKRICGVPAIQEGAIGYVPSFWLCWVFPTRNR